MKPPKFAIELAQTILKRNADPSIKVDGVFGRLSQKAAADYLPWTFSGRPSADRWVAALIQSEARKRGLRVGLDAFYGPQTEDAAEIISGIPVPPRPDESVKLKSGACRNPSTKEFIVAYGDVGTRQVMVRSPYPLRLDWDLSTEINHFSCHEKVVDSVEGALKDILSVYGLDRIKALGLNRFGGCLYVRNKRGGTTPSTHSWGVAIDWFPSANKLRETSKTARFARPEYKEFMDIWAVRGWMSLGRCFDFDWMHVQKNP